MEDNLTLSYVCPKTSLESFIPRDIALARTTLMLQICCISSLEEMMTHLTFGQSSPGAPHTLVGFHKRLDYGSQSAKKGAGRDQLLTTEH